MEATELTLTDGSRVAAIVVPNEELAVLRSSGRPVVEALRLPPRYTVVLVPDQGYVLSDGNGGLLIASLDDVRRVALDMLKHFGTPVLSGKNPYGAEFSDHVEDLVSGYLVDLGIKECADWAGRFEAVTKRFRQIGEAETYRYRKSHILAEVAFVGQAVIDKFGGSWTTTDEIDGSFTPKLLVDGVSYELAVDIVKSIEEEENPAAVHFVFSAICRGIAHADDSTRDGI
jgi:hypothetical protein